MKYKVNEDGTIEKEVEETKEETEVKMSESVVDVLGTCLIAAATAGIFLGGYILGKDAGFVKGRKIGHDMAMLESGEMHDSCVKDLLRRICPKTGVKYVVERFSDMNGRTYGSLEDYTNMTNEANCKMLEKLNTGLSRLADNLENLKKEA